MPPRTRKNAPPADGAQEAPSGGLTLTLARSEGVKRATTRLVVPDEVKQGVRASIEEAQPFAFTGLADENAAKQVITLLQRYQADLKEMGTEVGISKSLAQDKDGTWRVDFRAQLGVRKRNYTTEMVREWAVETGRLPAGHQGKVGNDVRKAYRVAHGYDKADAE